MKFVNGLLRGYRSYPMTEDRFTLEELRSIRGRASKWDGNSLWGIELADGRILK